MPGFNLANIKVKKGKKAAPPTKGAMPKGALPPALQAMLAKGGKK